MPNCCWFDLTRPDRSRVGPWTDRSWLSVAFAPLAILLLPYLDPPQYPTDVDEEVTKIQNAMGADIDVSFDCAGFSKTMSTALNATRPGGKVCLVGMGHNEMSVPLTPAAAREVDVVGIFRYKDTWPLCIQFLQTGKIDVKPLITHRYGFSQEDVEEAFEVSAGGSTAIKVMFNL